MLRPATMWRSILVLAAVLALGCSSRRDPEGLGPSYARYLAALKKGQVDKALRDLYAAFGETLRIRKPELAMRFFRPDMTAKERNAVRMGLEFTRVLTAFSGQIKELKVSGGQALLTATESSTFRFRGKSQPDRRSRARQMYLINGDWYFGPPDLGRLRKKRR